MLYKNISRSSFTLLILIISTTVFAQNSVGIGTENPNENAVLHLVSPNNDQGLLVPQLTTLERTSPALLARLGTNENGLLVFDSDDNQFYYWQDTQWQPISTNVNLVAGAGIDITGNTISNLGDADADAQNEIQDLQDVLGQGNDAGGTVISNLGDPSLAQDAATKAYVDGVIVADSDGDPTNEIQDLSIASNTLSISGSAATVDLTAYLDNSDSQDALNVPVVPAGNLASTDVQAALEELQGDIDGDTDSDPNNEIQDASGVAVTPVGNLVSVDVQAALEELQVDLDTDTDADPLNEIQNISITGNAIGIDGGGLGFNLSPLVPGSGEVLKWNGTQWEAATDATAAGSTLPLLGNAQIVTNNGANTAVSVSGDINMDNTGNMTVQPDAITTSEIQDLTVTDIDIDPGANIGVGKLNSSVMVETENVSLLNNDAGYLTNLATLSTDDLSEGISNLYYTDARVDTRLAFNSVTILSDVSNAGSGQIITAGERSGISTNSADIATLQATGLGFSQTPNQIYAGPPSGLAADPTFRTLVQADIPGLDASHIITGTLPSARGGTNSNSIGSAGTVAYSNGTAYQFSAVGTAGQILSSNGAGAPTWVNDNFGWGLNGNSGVNAVTDFVGSINAADVLFKSNNIERLRITSGGDAGIGGPGSAVTGNKLRVVQTLAASGDAIESVLNTTSPAGSSAALRTVVTNSGTGTSFGTYSSVTNVIGSSGGGTGYFTILNGDGDGARLGVNVNVSGGGTGSKYGYLTNVSTSAGANGYGLYVQDVAGSLNNYGVFIESLSNEPSFYPAIFMDGNVGIGTMAPASELDVLGTARMTGFQLTNLPTSGYVLTSNATGVGTWQAVPSSFSTPGQIPRGDGSGLSSSNMFSTGTDIGIGNSSPSYILDVLSSVNGTVVNVVNNHSGALTKRSLSLTSSATGTFTKQGIYNQVNGTPANGSGVTGVRNDIIPNGTGSAYGIYNDITSIGTGDRMGTLHNVRAGVSSASFIFGTRANIDHDGTGGSFGSYVNHTGSGSGTKYGFYSQGEDINYFSGNLGVGVGSINANYAVQIASNTATADLQIGNATSGNLVGDGLLMTMNNLEGTLINRENGNLSLGSNGLTSLYIEPSGNVGIGIATPATKLDVSGTITSTGFTMTTAPTLGYVLTSNGAGSGTWQAAPGASGVAGGDLTGTYPNPTIAGNAIGSAEITDNTVASTDILNNTILDADINASAGIAGTKISPDFGSQNVVTTGDVQVDVGSDFIYSSPKSHIYAITPAEFVILKNFFTQDFVMLTGITGTEVGVGTGGADQAANFGAPVHLPNGAVVTSIEVWGRNSSTTIPTNIYFVEKSFSTAQTPIFVTTIPINTGAFVTSYTNNALNIPINNNTDNYLLRVEASTDGGSITGVKIIYEVLRAD